MAESFIEYSFTITPLQPATDILMAQLAELAFDSFVETHDGILAYIKKEDQTEGMLKEVQILGNPDFKIRYSQKEILQENWNAKWEQNFEPIEIDKSCRIRAPFHDPFPVVAYDIVINPKMSFGTGHHETTHMMLELLLNQDLKGKSVLDMGSGTGVLAILAGMKGASNIDAIDIDHWSFLNARENVVINSQDHIKVYEGDVTLLKEQKYDYIIANINRNILLTDIPVYAKHLNPQAKLLLSGFYVEDLSMITDKCAEVQLQFEENFVKNNWVAAVYRNS